jgi:hypothetical protein
MEKAREVEGGEERAGGGACKESKADARTREDIYNRT